MWQYGLLYSTYLYYLYYIIYIYITYFRIVVFLAAKKHFKKSISILNFNFTS